MQWFARGMALNPYDCQTRLGYGLCLDWLDRPKEATRYFVQALELNPNGAQVQWKFAWHCMILQELSAGGVLAEEFQWSLAQPGSRKDTWKWQREDGGGRPNRHRRTIKVLELPGRKR